MTIEVHEHQPRIHRIWRVGEHWCVVADNGMAFYLGYVSVPEGHPWHGQDYEHIDADAHGGLTFAGERGWEMFTGADDGVPDGYYIGFDCGHYCCTPIAGSYMAEHWPVATSFPSFHAPWDVERVAAEVNRLAVQAQVMAIAGVSP